MSDESVNYPPVCADPSITLSVSHSATRSQNAYPYANVQLNMSDKVVALKFANNKSASAKIDVAFEQTTHSRVSVEAVQ